MERGAWWATVHEITTLLASGESENRLLALGASNTPEASYAVFNALHWTREIKLRLFSVSLKQMRCLPSQKQLSNREQEGWPIHPQKE